MGVDGIGGGGRPVHGVGASELAAADRVTSDPIQGAGAAEGVAGSSGSPALQQLERGEINVEQYLDTRVADAVRHLEGRFPASQIDFVRKALREELSSDPVLVELVRRTTGSPSASTAGTGAPDIETE
jgi:hypothetical protein